MAEECEVVIAGINKGEIERKLRKLGANYRGHSSFRRIEFLIGGKSSKGHTWGRVRTDGKVTTITAKRYRAANLPMEEHEVGVDDFEKAVKVMSRITSSKLCYFENERDTYKLGRLTITIDRWPGIPYYMEIEGPSMAQVKSFHRKLGIKGTFIGNPTLDALYGHHKVDFKKAVAKDQAKLRRILG